MADIFTTRISVRGYEVDSNGHVAAWVILQYGQHARWECLRSAGVDQDALLATGVGPVSLEENIRFHNELRAGDEVDISCQFVWSNGKTFRVEQAIHRSDGTLAAEVTNLGGLLDLKERRLVPDPGAHWRSAADAPEVLGL